MPTRSVLGILRAQRCLITRDQALGAGMSSAAVDRMLGAGRWERIHPTVYRLAGAPESWQQRCLAATLWHRRGGVALVRAVSALQLWGFGDGLDVPAIPEVLVTHASRDRTGATSVQRSAWLPPEHVAERQGIPVTSVDRTLLDVAPTLSASRLARCVEAAIRARRTDHTRLAALVESDDVRGRRGVRKLAEVLDDRAPGGAAAMEEGLEQAAWRLLRSSGLPMPIRQAAIVVDGVRWTVDFFWPESRVALETDGYGAHQSLTAFRQDRRKLRALATAGVVVLPATWDDVVHRPEQLLAELARVIGRGR